MLFREQSLEELAQKSLYSSRKLARLCQSAFATGVSNQDEAFSARMVE
jgi:hypothetical protein